MNGDLISREAVYKAFSDYLNRNFLGEISPEKELRVGEIASVISSVPTAFDKEKVMNEIKEYKEDAEKWANKSIENADEFYTYVDAYKNCLEIVEKGGVE